VYKTLGVKWLFERSAPRQRLCRQTVTKPAIPNVSYTQPLAFIVEEKIRHNENLIIFVEKVKK
jgi:hypothetical protein